MAKNYVAVVDGRVEVLVESDLRDMETSGIKGVITSQIGTAGLVFLLCTFSYFRLVYAFVHFTSHLPPHGVLVIDSATWCQW